MNLLRECRVSGLDALDQHGRFQMCHEDAMWRLWTHLGGPLRLMPIIAHGDASDARCVWPRSGRNIWRIQRPTNGPPKDLSGNLPWRRRGVGKRVRFLLEALPSVGKRTSRPALVKIRLNRRYAGLGDALRFSEQRNKDDRRHNRGFGGDGNNQGAA